MTDRYDKHRDSIRSRGFKVNPYRLGRVVAEAGEELPSPYTLARSAKLYNEGVRVGDRIRREKK